MRKEYLLDTKWACGLIVVGDDGKVIDACPIYRKKMLGLTIEEIKEVIIASGKSRLRPVLLTALTAVLGLIPLAIGLNFDFFTLITDLNPHFFMGGDNVIFWGPLAWTIIFGLTYATVLTLVMVPVMFYLVKRTKYWLRDRKKS